MPLAIYFQSLTIKTWQNSWVIIFFYFIFIFIFFLFGLTTQGRSVGKYHMTMLHVTVTCQDATRSCHMNGVT